MTLLSSANKFCFSFARLPRLPPLLLNCCPDDDKLLQNAIFVCCFSCSTSSGRVVHSPRWTWFGFLWDAETYTFCVFYRLTSFAVYEYLLLLPWKVTAKMELNWARQKLRSARHFVSSHSFPRSRSISQYILLFLRWNLIREIAIKFFYDWKTIKQNCWCLMSSRKGGEKINQHFNIAKIGRASFLLPLSTSFTIVDISRKSTLEQVAAAAGSNWKW